MKLLESIYKQKYWRQFLATFTGSLAILNVGVNTAWTSPYLPQIINGTYPGISITTAEGSWIAVMPFLAAPFGGLISACLVDRIGRKTSTLIMAPVTLLMFIALAFAKTTLLLCLIRFIIGCVSSTLYTTLSMYLGEISQPAIRGFLTASIPLCSLLGAFLINILGFNFSILTSSLICAAIPVVHVLSFIWMPESPYYFIRQNMEEEARKSLSKLRGGDDVENELKALIEAVNDQINSKRTRLWDVFAVRSNRFALFIFVILNLTRKFSGSSPLLFYTTSIFQTADGSISPEMSVIIFLCIQIGSATVSLNVLDLIGRRPVIITSTIACIIMLSIIGTYFYCKDQHPDYIQEFKWAPLTFLTIHMLFYNLGLELTPMVYASELFPMNVKAPAMSVVVTISAFNGFITLKAFQILTDRYGMYVPFWVFGIGCGIGLVLIVKYVPETKNKTLEEIQQDLFKRTRTIKFY